MMDINSYIRETAAEEGWKKYYMRLRPVSIGTCPKKGMMDYINYDSRTNVNGSMVWAEVYYNRELTDEELKAFEMEIA